MAPFALVEALGKAGAYAIYLLIGMGFGATLEAAGFANSRKLANQFYLKDMTVLKVMFTGIITAMVLTFFASSLGYLSYNDLYVNPTYLWPGIVGGLIMGVGFILGGFCPGTSLVAAASAKVDGWFFVLGTLLGVFAFGELVGSFDTFFYSSYLGRFTLPDLLGLSTGTTILLVAFMALVTFWLAEKAEARFGTPSYTAPDARPLPSPFRLAGAGGLVLAAIVLMGMGQPTPAEKWEILEGKFGARLEERQVHVQPGELIAVAANRDLRLILMDVRNERDYNLFHLVDSERVPLEEIAAGSLTRRLLDQPANTVIILVSNDEARAEEAWKLLTAEGVMNVYLLAGGINGWLDLFAVNGACRGCRRLPGEPGEGTLLWEFDAALGSQRPIANPDLFADHDMPFERKVELEVRSRPAGGCG